MLTNWLILDVASAPIPDAASYVEGQVKAPANWKDADKIAEYVREKEAERVAMAATDIDLARVTGIATASEHDAEPSTWVAREQSRDGEAHQLADLGAHLSVTRPTIVTFGGSAFDLPLLMRRARYLGVDFPSINLDRYKSPHVDLCELLSDRNPQRKRSLLFYAKRLGWTDISKPLSGAEEARVPETGKWEELEESLRHDVTATYRLACWLNVIQPQPAMSAAQEASGF